MTILDEAIERGLKLQEERNELLRGLEAAIAALDYAAQYVTWSAHAEIWAHCNGYECSPDIKAIVEKMKGPRK